MNLVVRMLCVLISAGVLAGCASTRQTGSVNELQIRVAQLEREVASKDETIAALQQRTTQSSGRSGRSSSVSTAENRGIIRVPASVRDVQTALQRAGYYSGNIDGKIGGQTIEGIKRFQKDNHLKVDGVIGASTWTKLQNAPAPRAVTESATETGSAE